MNDQRRPIRPAPPAAIHYPRARALWRALATGTLAGVAGLSGGVAQADCALPQHEGTIDPSTQPVHVGPVRPLGSADARAAEQKAADKKATEKKPTDKKPTPDTQVLTVTGGVPPPVRPDRPPLPGGLMPVVAPEDVKKKPATKPQRTQPVPKVDGGFGSVQPLRPRVLTVHAHGPDEPCHDARELVIRFEGEEPA